MSDYGPRRYRIAGYAASPTSPSSRWGGRRILRAIAVASCWLYLAMLLALWGSMSWSLPEFWPAHLFLYGPRWVLSLPALALVPMVTWLRLRWPSLALRGRANLVRRDHGAQRALAELSAQSRGITSTPSSTHLQRAAKGPEDPCPGESCQRRAAGRGAAPGMQPEGPARSWIGRAGTYDRPESSAWPVGFPSRTSKRFVDQTNPTALSRSGRRSTTPEERFRSSRCT